MSMNGQFRQLSSRALQLLNERPELVQAALDWDGSASPAPAAGAAGEDPLAGLPANVRRMFEHLPEEMQRMAAAKFTGAREAFAKRSPLAAQFVAREQEEDDEEREALRAAGIGDDDLPEPLGIHKSWHGLHFLLAGKAWETGDGAGQAVLGGAELGEDFTGYVAARVMTPGEAAAVAEALGALDEGELRARFRADAFRAADIYSWEDSDDYVDEMAESFRVVRDYYADARRRGYGMLLVIV